MSPQEPKPGDRVTVDPTMADEEVLPAPVIDEDDEDEDDIVPGPLDEEDDEDHSPLSNSVPGEDLPIDVDDGDPAAPLTPISEPS